MSSICIITARGGSKRIPRKNIREFCGKPIIAYSIEAALESGIFDEVMVSTDDEEIAQVAREYGAKVPFMRSAKNSDDFSTTRAVVLEVLDEYAKRGMEYSWFCCIYPTAPFVTAEKLKKASALFDEDTDTVLSITSFSFPPQRGLISVDNGVAFWMPENASARSQDLQTIYHDAGQFYFCKTDSVRASQTLLGIVTKGFEVSELEVQDIDNPSDWALAEMKYERMVSIDEPDD